jgi:N-acetylated-alpha-linked acidic dipeptidase
LIALPAAEHLRAWHDLVSREPHVAGRPGDARVVDALARALSDLGLEVERQELRLDLPFPVRAELEITAPRRLRLALKEDVLPGDAYSRDPNIDPGWNAWSGRGEAAGSVVYANYGTREDFARLKALGVEVRGHIVLVRYGKVFRGDKARDAEEAGASGLVIFTDPKDSGYGAGPAYPEGGWANPSQIQRGSILDLPYAGDPFTPFVPATADAQRVDPATVPFPKIPVQPIGYRAAQEILSRMQGPAVPSGWQGGLPFAYRLTGGDALRVRLRVEQELRPVTTANVLGVLRGARFPEERVIVGSHHDAWTFGAGDPGAGTIVVLELARAFAEAARAGSPPDRTIVFANWAAEEFALIGSTEWVEAHEAELGSSAVAYLNLDAAALGPEFQAAASPSLKELIAEASAAVPDTNGHNLLATWLGRGEDTQRPGAPQMGDLGGGSDHVAFLCHAGVAAAGFSAGGSAGTAYHSAYDDLHWYRQVVGEDYASARLVTRMSAVFLARLANADLLPLDPAAYGLEFRRHLAAMRPRVPDAGLALAEAAAKELETRARAARADWLGRLERGAITDDDLLRVNARLVRSERLWLLPGGLPDRPWYKSAYVAPSPDAGYDAGLLPLLREPLDRGELLPLARAEATYVDRLQRVAEEVAAPLDLDGRVRSLLAGFNGRVSLFAKNLDTGAVYGREPDAPVRTASTIKLPILVEAFAEVAEGKARWDEELVLTAESKVEGAGILPEMDPGLRLTLRDAVRLMITISDNTATNLVLDRFGADAVNARMEALGLGETRSLRKISGGARPSRARRSASATASGSPRRARW